jgi:hypothetical protein
MEDNPLRNDSERIQRAIEARRPLSELALLFPNRLDALRYYADYMAQKFEHPRSTSCIMCGHTEAAHEEVYTWEAIVNTRVSIFWSFLVSAVTLLAYHFISWFYRVQFTTRHCFCESCSRMAARKRFLSSGLQFLFFAILITALLAVVPITVFLIAILFVAPELAPRAALLWLLALALLVWSVAGFTFCRRLAIPPTLSEVGRFPFTVKRVQRIA